MQAIKVNNLSKSYKIYDKPIDRLKESINPFKKKYHKDFFALNDISFEVDKGDTVGIIGQNGSGKSTLLKIITGVLTPSSGEVTVDGKISALLELGAGFNPEFTGLENIYFNGIIMGYSKEEMDERIDKILLFADIGDFINQPVKTYSSGMFVRLAFSVATSVEPDIIIVDEALSVGDMFFQAKSMDRMKTMVDNGTTLLFVSHDMGAIKSICNKSILLDKGRIIEYDKSDKVVEKYFAMKVKSEQEVLDHEVEEKNFDKVTEDSLRVSEKSDNVIKDDELIGKAFNNNAEFKRKAQFGRIQNGKANFVNILLLNESGHEISYVDYDQDVILRMAIEINEDIRTLCFGYHIRDKNGVDLVYSDSIIENKNLSFLKKGDKYLIDWKFKASLIQGNYNIACTLSIPINIEVGKVDFCDFVPLAVQFNMAPRKGSHLYGHVHWDNSLDIQKNRLGEI